MALSTTSLSSWSKNILPTEFFAKLPAFHSPRLSPNGNYLAATIMRNGKPVLLVQSLSQDTPREVYPIALGNKKINEYSWANNERLIISYRTTVIYQHQNREVNRFFSINKDGTKITPFEMSPNNDGFLRTHPEVIDWLPSDPEHVLATLDDNPKLWNAPEVDKVNIYTGEKQRVKSNHRHIQEWYTDSAGTIRLGVKYDAKHHRRNVSVFHRSAENGDWELLQKTDSANPDRIIPVKFHPTNKNILIVENNKQTLSDENDYLEYDLTKKQVTGPYVNQNEVTVTQILKRSLPELEFSIESRTNDERMYFVRAYSDTVPPTYYLLNLESKELHDIASEYPELENQPLSKMKRVNYSARDGLNIPAYLTLPHQKRTSYPTIVFPHGGPWAHDQWGFNNYVQFLANRGYAVFQPQFRGSTGFGQEHLEQGYGQWGYDIQDDITDGVNWLIQAGIADANNICIIGGSFGGYAAITGLFKTPDLYQCGVSINGVMDLKMHLYELSDYMFSSHIMNKQNERSSAEAVSPFHQAKKIKAPILLLHGAKDTVVPVEHSRNMEAQLKTLNKSVKYIEFENGEHWSTNETIEVATLKAIEQFLAKHLKANTDKIQTPNTKR